MPKWTVTYSTETEPTNLPAGAEVVKVAEYPVTVRRGSARLDLHRVPPTRGALAAELVASVKVSGRIIHLNDAEARQLAAELVTLADARMDFRRKEADAERQRRAYVHAQQQAARVRGVFQPRYVGLADLHLPSPLGPVY